MIPLKNLIHPFVIAVTALSPTILVYAQDTALNPARPITHKLQIQGIRAQQDAAQGGEIATGFGTETQQDSILSLLDQVWAQAGIGVEILPTRNYISSFTYNGFEPGQTYDPNAIRNADDFNTIFQNPNIPFSENPSVLNIVFVDHMPGRTKTSNFTVSGNSIQDGNGTMLFIGAELLDFQNGITAVTDLVSRQIGINLGLTTSSEPENLMQPADAEDPGQRITQGQIDTIFSDDPTRLDGFDLLQPIPEPATALLLPIGILTLMPRRRT